MTRFAKLLMAAAAACLAGGSAQAAQPEPWGLGFQTPASALAEQAYAFHDMLLVIITVITVFVLALLIYVIFKFNRKANPDPTRTTHNTLLEIVWTAVPILILVIIAIPSIRLLYDIERIEGADMTFKAIGYQWYWTYEYPDHGNFTFDAFMVADEDLAPGQPRLLATDEDVVLPTDTRIRVLVTAGDVLHAWAMPSLMNKVDAVPGRINELIIDPVSEPGMYYGQCSELCGKDHSYMPIAVRFVTPAEFEAWVVEAQAKYARVDGTPPPVEVAARQSR